MVRTIQLGPEDMPLTAILALFGDYYRTRFKIPAGGTLTYIVIRPPANTPPTWVRAMLYQSRRLDDAGFESNTVIHQLIPIAYPWGARDYPMSAIWEGRHRVDDNFEYTLELLVHDGTGASSPVWRTMAIVEVDE